MKTVPISLLIGSTAIAWSAIVLAAIGWARYLGEKRLNDMLRTMLTYGVPSAPQPYVQPPPEEPEDRAARSLPPTVTAENVKRGADELLKMAKEFGVEMSREQAEAEATAALAAAYNDAAS